MSRTSSVVICPSSACRDAPLLPGTDLRFPLAWKAPLNRFSKAAEEETIEWFRTTGLLQNEAEESLLKRFQPGLYAGFALPYANYRSYLFVTEFVCLWLFWDDLAVEKEATREIDQVAHALLCGEAPKGSSRFIAGWADLGKRLRASQYSEAWLGRLVGRMRDWMMNSRCETSRAKSGARIPFEDYLEVRTISIGMYPTFLLIEFSEGIELPGWFYEQPLVVELQRLASRLVALGNDLMGVAKDIRDKWPNAVTILSEELDLPIDAAFRKVVDMHNEYVARFEHLASHISSTGSPALDVQIAAWLQAVRYNVQGWTVWESVCSRYQDKKAIVDGKSLAARILFGECRM